MSWRYNNTRIYVDKFDSKQEQIIARLQPLVGSTILHIFGNDSEILNIGGLVATEADKNALVCLVASGTAYTLSGPEGIIGNYYPKSIVAKRSPIINICLEDRPGLPEDSPVYEVALELYTNG